ncbi:MAG: CehA/McbA family metallohydrolase [Caldilineaceae bacterium]
MILLEDAPVTLPLGNQLATYVLFLHVVEDRVSTYQEGFADFAVDGNELGDLVSEYAIEYADDTQHSTPIHRRFAIQQPRIAWGASPFTAVPALGPSAFPSATEAQILGRVPWYDYGAGETRHISGRESMRDRVWIYALPNPQPDKPIRQLVLTPKDERSVIFAVTITQVTEHPLRPGVRRKLHLTLPEGTKLNAIHELEDIAIDLGTVISARAALEYDPHHWLSDAVDAQPVRSERAIVVEYAAHPQAKLYVQTGENANAVYDLATPGTHQLIHIEPAHRPVKLRVVEKEGAKPVPVRLHLHGALGEYLPPRGYHRKVNPFWFEDNYGEFVNIHNQYAYIPGECVVDLPLGEVFVEITRGYEVAPIRRTFEVTPEMDEITFELDRVLKWRDRGWVTADTHVHFLSPQTALLEGQAEGVNVVNLLASQWGEMFSNTTDFDGRTTFGASDLGGDGEFLVRVGTDNRMQVLGHISLLGYSGQMITPLCTGGPTESAIGDPLEVTMAEWAQRCIEQGGLTVMPHGPNPQCERAADIVLGLINAMEMMTFNPIRPDSMQINPYGVADWYRYLNLGYQVPVVGGSDKMSASSLLGGIRTYANLQNRPLTYENWMRAVRGGNTFVTVGPLAEMSVEGVLPGGHITLPEIGGAVSVNWSVESVRLPVEQVEIVVGGLVAEQVNVGGQLSASGSAEIPITESTWIALRVRGSYQGKPEQIAAHTSAVQVRVGDKPIFSQPDAILVLEQIEGALAFVDTIAPRPDALRFKHLRATLEAAHNRMHQMMHRNGVFHQHTPLHEH